MPRRPKLVPVKKGTDNLPWVLNVPASLSESGRRERRFFETKASAETVADQIKIKVRNFGVSGDDLTPAQRESAAKAFQLLGNVPASNLVELVRQHLKAERVRNSSITVAEWEQAVMNKDKSRSPKYLKQIGHVFAKLAPHAETKVSDLTAATLENVLAPLPPANRNLHLRILRAALNFAIKRKWATVNPIAELDFAKIRTGEVAILSPRQVARLLVACKRMHPDLLPHHLFGIFAGIRPEELLRLKWENVHLDDKSIVLPGAITKTGKRRVVEMEPTLVAWLGDWKARGGTMSGAVTPPTNLRRRLRAIRKRAGLSKWVQDCMRHTYASNWIEKHGDFDRLLMHMGHHSLKVLRDHYQKAVMKKDAESFWRLVPRVMRR